MLAEGGACAGVFLPVRLHLTPGVRARFGRVARVSTRVVSLISVLRQGVSKLFCGFIAFDASKQGNW